MAWINLCLSVAILSMYAATTNSQDIPHFTRTYPFVVTYSGHHGANAFLWISGFLIAFNYKDILPTVKDLLLRLLRILPTMWVAMLLGWKVIPYGLYIEAPLWFRQTDLQVDCHEYWWTNFLLINNFYPDGKGNY